MALKSRTGRAWCRLGACAGGLLAAALFNAEAQRQSQSSQRRFIWAFGLSVGEAIAKVPNARSAIQILLCELCDCLCASALNKTAANRTHPASVAGS